MSQLLRSPEMPVVSVIVPAFNEAARIAEPLRRIDAYLAAQAYPSEIVVVDDGSTDDTQAAVVQLIAALQTPVRLYRYAANRGKGHALKVGFAEAAGQLLLFTDADLSTPIEEAGRLLAPLQEGFDIAIGSRRIAGAQVVVHQPWYRQQLGAVFTRLVRLLIAPVSDATCGFKAFTRRAGKDIFGRVRRADWSFDAEVLFLATRLGYRVQQVPVRWADQAGTKVRLGRDALRSLVGLFAIRANAVLGRYEHPAGVTRLAAWTASDTVNARVDSAKPQAVLSE